MKKLTAILLLFSVAAQGAGMGSGPSNNGILKAKLNGFSSSVGVVSSSDTILTAIQKLSGTTPSSSSPVPVASGGTGQTSYTDGQLLIGNSSGNTLAKGTLTAGANINVTNAGGAITLSTYGNASVFGTGSDGDVVISAGTTTLTRDMSYRNLTISGTGSLNTRGWRVFVSNTLDLSAAPATAITGGGATGANASGATGGTIPGTGIGAPLNFAATNAGGGGTTGTTGVGTQPSAVGTSVFGNGGDGGVGGGGGTSGTANAGGAGGLAGKSNFNPNSAVFSFPSPIILPAISASGNGGLQVVWPSYPGGGGAAGGGGTGAGGGGGGGGIPSYGIALYARFIQRGTNSTASIITGKGGTGGNGAAGVSGTAGGGGGGGGAGGAFVYIVAESLLGSTITNAIDVSGGTGGNAGNGVSSGAGGVGGTGGAGGVAQLVVLSPASFTASAWNTAGTAGNAASGATGGTGGAGATVRANL